MTLPKLPLLLLALLLLSACNTKKIAPPAENNKTYSPITVVETLPLNNSTKIELEIKDKTNQKEEKEEIQTKVEIEVDTKEPQFELETLEGDFAGNSKLIEFIDYMSNYHQFTRKELYKLFSNAKDINQMIEPCKIRNNNGSCAVQIRQGKWDRYRAMFVYEHNIERGLAFWTEYENILNQAHQTYGVPPEYIVGIIGVETAYGVNFGKKKVIDVLTSKAMLGDRRENFYTRQLEKFLIMTRQAGLNPVELMGSNAGAMGYGQFIASSYLDFAVDFNNDGVTDLWNAEDAIGSVANYFAQNGWNSNISQVAVRARYKGNRFRRLKTGYKTKYSQRKLRKKYKIVPRSKLYYKGPVSLIKLPKASYDELWLGTHNFRVITTYNHSSFYAMAVHDLGQAVKKRRGY
jgi:membrane-bound lytic murein transglycosylase B